MPYAELSEAHCDADLNARSVLTASCRAMPWLKRQGGFIVNTSSIAARNGADRGTLYGSAKAFVSTRGMAKELIGSRQRGGAGHHRLP
ncbi:SDR family NAD(P)-dependent oxidoreductase [Mesorhizobium sp.]|uniref:SDR family NAD(P)-dependent oxidoreductase n=1 Tax=Mesorhizobium sp. TaxID=1871066 RepID=UPI00257DBBE5|nr:SDR family NAD(P)-dependent oxidoreductase [Mesorhizobium sp.]